MNYYNEHDPKAAAWLRELMRAGQIPQGDVDERSIKDVRATDLLGYCQCHFFAGIGGWPLALALAGWPEDWPVFTGSCPCQPFSEVGEGGGVQDPRHLWPWFRHLIFRCRPATAFGEQVAGPAGLVWLTGVRANLETLGYAVGAADLCAAGVGAPHRRQRLYWVAHTEGQRRGGRRVLPLLAQTRHARIGDAGRDGAWDAADILSFRDGATRRAESGTFPLAHGLPGRVGLLRGYGNAIVPQVAAQFVGAWLDLSQNDQIVARSGDQ